MDDAVASNTSRVGDGGGAETGREAGGIQHWQSNLECREKMGAVRELFNG